ncbi:MAG: 2Fe-2S iron-sulfur cluster-binding protein [Mycoplasmoidaceae bacterium]|nr:2Fe-2S iron-sulfur cluster-binding protein [Mycoplasmoidaceae bacterium]
MLRDAKHVVGVAGGSGITPFVSMAEAIADGTEDFNLTIVYGARNAKSLLFKKELDEIAAKCKKVKVVYVLEDKQGFITTDIIKANAKGDFSLFVCGPRGLYKAMDKVASDLKLAPRRFRKEVFGEYGDPTNDKEFPKQLANKEFKLTVKIRNKEYNLRCRSNETLLNAMEKGGVHAPSRCRSGECGWCHSLLVSGSIYTPKVIDGRRLADHTFN